MTRRGLLGRLASLLALPAALAACSVATPAPAPGVSGPRRITYGSHPSQFGELTLPAGAVRGVAVVVHGGFWRQSYGLELGRPLAADLANRGLAAWNIEYRRVAGGSAGGPRIDTEDGGWTATFDDVAAAIDLLAAQSLPLDRVVAIGHSAGGQLVGWAAARPGLPAGTPGASPKVRLRGAVAQAGVMDLVDASRQGVGSGAVENLMGGSPTAVPDRYALASPIARLPIGVPVTCVHGTEDGNVPLRQSQRFTAASGDRLVTIDGADHFALIDPTTDAWRVCRDAADAILA